MPPLQQSGLTQRLLRLSAVELQSGTPAGGRLPADSTQPLSGWSTRVSSWVEYGYGNLARSKPQLPNALLETVETCVFGISRWSERLLHLTYVPV